jgi:hypothetical protein
MLRYLKSRPLNLGQVQSFELTQDETIPMTLLARQDPVLDTILFYDDVPMFEDELHDNGDSILNVRIVSVDALL